MAGHLLSIFLGENHPEFPYVALAASGGHSSIFLVNDPLTYKLLGRTRDDAAGEAFDKVSKLLGLGYPGGPIIDRLAPLGDPQAWQLPRSDLGLDFTFSGLKTAVRRLAIEQSIEPGDPQARAELILAAYDDLRRLASGKMASERQNHT